MATVAATMRRRFMLATSTAALALTAAAIPQSASAIVFRPDVNPTSVQDTGNAWPWVGQMIAWDNRAVLGFGTCTGQIVAPRVVAFAAHCFGGVTNNNSERYGTGAGLRDMAFMFNPNNLSALRQWVGLDPSTTAIGASNEANRVYRVIDIVGHPRNVLNNFTAGNADVALAVLDQPVFGFDGYSMLFSPLTALERVELVGYGRSGTSDQGQVNSVDWRRRAGENMLSFIGSDNDVFGSPLFGSSAPVAGYNGDLLWTDCDSPTVPRPAGDFNIFGGAALPNEVCIAQGDSGGAMWIRRGGSPIALGVASYGYSFGGTPSTFGRGTMVAHTPFFPYWDFIVANNAYVYASAVAGGGAWENAATWVQILNPQYLSIGAGGAFVNALPTTAPVSDTGGAPNVGGVRPTPATPVPNSDGIGLGASAEGGIVATRGDFFGLADLNDTRATATLDGTPVAGLAAAAAAVLERPDPVPASSGFFPVGTTPLSGPGSTNFVPNNTNGTPGTQFTNAARFFEIWFQNTGTVTLSSARTVDRVRVLGAASGLTINAGGALTTVMGTSLESGALTNNGTLRARAIAVTGGLLSGSGLYQATGGVGVSGAVQSSGLFQLAGGTMTPGAANGVGSIGIQGNAEFLSGVAVFDITGAGAAGADWLNIAPLAGATGNNGRLTLTGGTIAANFLFQPDAGQRWTVIGASGGITAGGTTLISNLPGLLRTRANLSATAYEVEVFALPMTTYLAGLTGQNVNQFATALDAARAGNATSLRDLYRALDVLSPADLQRALEQLAPTGLPAADQVQDLLADLMATNVTGRLAQARGGSTAGLGAGAGLTALGGGAVVDPAALPVPGLFELAPGWGAFVDIRYAEGDASPALIANGADVEAFAVTAGIDNRITDNWIAGLALNYAGGESVAAVSKGETATWAVTAYTGYTAGRFFFDAYASLGEGTVDTTRAAGGAVISGSTSGTFFALGAAAGLDVDLGDGFGLIPAISLEHQSLGLDRYAESGGAAALIIPGRDIDSTVVRFGGTLHGDITIGTGTILRPRVTLNYAWDAADSGTGIGSASFVSAPGVVVSGLTANAGDDQWFEGSVGFDVKPADDDVSLSLSYERDFDRDNFETETFRATLRLQF